MRWSRGRTAGCRRAHTGRTRGARAARGRSGRTAAGDARRRTSSPRCSCRCWRRPRSQTIERYYLAIALLIGAGSGRISQQALEERCQLMAQRMTMLYGFNSPEFFDRSLFENFIDLLRARGVVQRRCGRAAGVRRGADPRRRRCPAGAVGADPAQHPAGYPFLSRGLAPRLRRCPLQPACNACRHSAILSSRRMPACAGLVEGRRTTSSPGKSRASCAPKHRCTVR